METMKPFNYWVGASIVEEDLKVLNKKMSERNGEPYIYFCTNKVIK